MSFSRVVINPKYQYLSDFVDRIPQIFESEGEIIYCDRNLIKVFDVNGLKVNVKRYCIPKFLFNRIIYMLFRAPKAQRAYDYALKLKERGFQTPEPIAYILGGSCGVLLGYTYFISIQEPLTHDIEDFQDRDDFTADELEYLAAFGRYTAALHEAGVYHNDFGGGNVLFNVVDGVPQFMLLDINRMDFGEVSLMKGYDNFRRLRISDTARRAVAEAYALARGFDVESAFDEIVQSRERQIRRRRVKELRRFIGIKK